MTEKEMIEAEKYWCGECCNFDREHIRIDGFAKCRFTNTLAYAEECGKDCRGFNKPVENILVRQRAICENVYLPDWYGKEKYMNYIHLELKDDGKVKGIAEIAGERFEGVFVDMELAIEWASGLEENKRGGKEN